MSLHLRRQLEENELNGQEGRTWTKFLAVDKACKLINTLCLTPDLKQRQPSKAAACQQTGTETFRAYTLPYSRLKTKPTFESCSISTKGTEIFRTLLAFASCADHHEEIYRNPTDGANGQLITLAERACLSITASRLLNVARGAQPVSDSHVTRSKAASH